MKLLLSFLFRCLELCMLRKRSSFVGSAERMPWLIKNPALGQGCDIPGLQEWSWFKALPPFWDPLLKCARFNSSLWLTQFYADWKQDIYARRSLRENLKFSIKPLQVEGGPGSHCKNSCGFPSTSPTNNCLFWIIKSLFIKHLHSSWQIF